MDEDKQNETSDKIDYFMIMIIKLFEAKFLLSKCKNAFYQVNSVGFTLT